MTHRLLLSLAFTLTPLTLHADDPPLVAATAARTPAEEKRLIKLPPGFELQLVACEPDIAKPMNLAFDHKGRLWVTSSLEYPFPAEGRPGRDMVHVLEDFAPDGTARKVSLFAKYLNIPIGILPRRDGAIVYSINSVDYLRGPVGQLYQKRDKLFGGFGHRDTHGMVNSFTLGYDGWIYACHGYVNDSVTKGSDGQELRMNSGNVFRMKADGSHVEIFTRGQVNPFGMCLDPWGNLYSADCHTKPMTQLIRGAYYDSFGKPHDGLGYGPNMMGHMHDSTGLCGLIYYDADQFPPQYRGTMFVCNPVTSRINHDHIVYKGATPEAVLQPDFLISGDPWCRPVYMTLGPDGAIYFADFYNRIIGHYEVPLSHPGRDRTRGRIWRIVYKGADAKPTPAPHGGDFTKATVEELFQDLDHPNITVRLLAANELVDRGEETRKVVDAQWRNAGLNRRALTLWVWERLGCLGDSTLRRILAEEPALVRSHALRILAERRLDAGPTLRNASAGGIGAPLRVMVREALHDADERVRRAAADALGNARTTSPEDLRALMAARRKVRVTDTHLLHTIRIAERNQLAGISEEDLATFSKAELTELSDIILGIRSERGGVAAWRLLEAKPAWGELLPKLVQHTVRYQPGNLAVIREVVNAYPADLPIRAALTQAVVQGIREARGSVPSEVKEQAGELAQRLCTSNDPKLVQVGIDLCANARLTDQFETLLAVAAKAQAAEETRTAALAALAGLDGPRAVPHLLRALGNSEYPMESRERAASLLAGMNQPAIRASLLQTLTTVPSRLANVVAYNLANARVGAEELLQAVEQHKVPASVLLTTSVQSRIFNHKVPGFRERYSKLTQGLPPADVRLGELVQQRAARFKPETAKAEMGAKVFTQHCVTCHQIGGQGAKVGPQLDGVGIRGVERLLEDILDPNRNVDQAFRASVLVLKDGRTLSGLVLREEGNLVVVADAQGKEQRLDKADIDEQKISNLSPMPATFDTQLSEADLNHLLAYLLTQQAKK